MTPKSLLLGLICLSALNLQASWLKKGLKALVPTAAAGATYLHLEHASDLHQRKQNYLLERRFDTDPESQTKILFNPEKQAYLRNLVKSLYPSDKPLYFGFEGNKTGMIAFAMNYSNANYVFIEYDRLPEVARWDSETTESFSEMRQKSYNLYAAMPLQEFKKAIEDNMSTIRHEIGHLVHDDTNRTFNKALDLASMTAGTCGLLNTLLMKGISRKNISKLNLAGRLCTITALIPASMFYKVYKYQSFSRENEREADAYDIAHAPSVRSLKATQEKLQTSRNHEIKEEEKHKKDGATPIELWKAHFLEKYFQNDHPLTQERIDAYQNAIKNFTEKK